MKLRHGIIVSTMNFLFLASIMKSQIILIDFDDASKWTAGSGGIGSYQNNHTYSENGWLFTGGPALRDTTANQDGFPRAIGNYSWRLRDSAGVDWIATFTDSLPANTYFSSFGFDVRRWDDSPNPNYDVSFSIDGGVSYTSVFSINNAALENSSDWKSLNFSTGSPVSGLSPSQFVVSVRRNGGERIMIDNFTATITPIQPPPGTPAAVPEPSTYGILGALLLAGMIVMRRVRR